VEVSQKFTEFLAKIKIGILCTYVKKKKSYWPTNLLYSISSRKSFCWSK